MLFIHDPTIENKNRCEKQDHKTQVSQGENLDHPEWELPSPTENLGFLAAGEPKSSQFETQMAVSARNDTKYESPKETHSKCNFSHNTRYITVRSAMNVGVIFVYVFLK